MLFPLKSIHAEPIILNSVNATATKSKRTPICLPTAFIEGTTISFDYSCIGCALAILQDEVLVYACTINEEGNIELPDYLTGVFELRLQRGSTTFVGEFEL